MLNILLTRMIVGDAKTAILGPSFCRGYRISDMIHEGGKASVFYYGVTETELQKNLSRRRSHA